MVRVFVTDHTAYFMDGKIRGKQYFFCFIQTSFREIAERRLSVKGGKFPAQAVAAHLHCILKRFQREFFFVMIIQKIMNLSQVPGRLLKRLFGRWEAGCADISKDHGQILMHLKQGSGIRGIWCREKGLDAAYNRRSQREGKALAAFSKSSGEGGHASSADKK